MREEALLKKIEKERLLVEAANSKAKKASEDAIKASLKASAAKTSAENARQTVVTAMKTAEKAEAVAAEARKAAEKAEADLFEAKRAIQLAQAGAVKATKLAEMLEAENSNLSKAAVEAQKLYDVDAQNLENTKKFHEQFLIFQIAMQNEPSDVCINNFFISEILLPYIFILFLRPPYPGRSRPDMRTQSLECLRQIASPDIEITHDFANDGTIVEPVVLLLKKYSQNNGINEQFLRGNLHGQYSRLFNIVHTAPDKVYLRIKVGENIKTCLHHLHTAGTTGGNSYSVEESIKHLKERWAEINAI